ncbi:MAG: serine--tRNA ligase [Planctomycetaceae bacterium]|jgi:seryl-tRNA synthetase|nr:serine--tRNA ligase [Planctomycetaceae bacterium]
MLDRKFIFDNVELVKKNCANRGVAVDMERFVTLELLRKEKQQQLEDLNRRANDVSKLIGKSKLPDEKQKSVEEGRIVRETTAVIKNELDKISDELDKIHRAIPNMAHPDAPIGADDQANLEFALGKTEIPKFDFEPKDHVEIAEKLGLIDFDGGARVAGAGFYFLKKEAVLLEIALQHYAVENLMKSGFTPMTTPDLARNDILQGTGFNPRGNETQIYSIENSDLCLIATAEITLGGLLANKTVDTEELPLRFCGISHCFRTEAGAAGRASRGLYRVHQFTKIEMFAFTLPEQSDAIHQEMLQIECQIFDGLGIPYRIVDTATGDLGGPAYRKYDLEAWMPGRNAYGEVTSTSNCTDYQARRLNARYKVKGEKGTHFLHTLNGTAIAISRALVAILELYQQADGSVKVPLVLQKYVGFDSIS